MDNRYKFRGLSSLGIWIYGYLYNRNDGYYIRDENEIEHKVKPETIGQCTCLKDKNGVLIYEGDLLKKTFRNKAFSSNYKEKEKIVKVVWNEEKGAFIWRLLDDKDVDDYKYYSEIVTFENDEIVGNIHTYTRKKDE